MSLVHATIPGLSARAYTADYYEQHKAAGLDYLGHGQWQIEYGQWLVQALDLANQPLLDVGCACGSILRGLLIAGADAQGVDLSEHMIALGRQAWPDIADRLHTADAVNLHLFADSYFAAVHSAQVAEHWRPEHVPLILAELARVTRPDGILWVCLDTAELYERQNRRPETEDPTHVCIRPMAWWHEHLRAAGWDVCTSDVQTSLEAHPLSYLKLYDWAWFAARRRGGRVDEPSSHQVGNADGELG